MKKAVIAAIIVIFSVSACSAPKPPKVDGSSRVPVNTQPININNTTVL